MKEYTVKVLRSRNDPPISRDRKYQYRELRGDSLDGLVQELLSYSKEPCAILRVSYKGCGVPQDQFIVEREYAKEFTKKKLTKELLKNSEERVELFNKLSML